MEKKNTTQNKIVILGSIICSIVLLGVLSTYAYFLINITQDEKQKINVETGNIELTFKDGNGEINESLEFGKSITKTFTITNNGSLDIMAKINWADLTNTYLDGSLTYTLSYSSNADGPYTNIIENEHIPRSEHSSTKELANGLEVPSKTTYYYNLTITLNYTDFDQTSDLKSIFSTHFTIEEGTTKSLQTLKTLNIKLTEENTTFTNIAPNILSYNETTSSVNNMVFPGSGCITYGTGYKLDYNTGTFSLTGTVKTVSNSSLQTLVNKYHTAILDSNCNIKKTDLLSVYKATSLDGVTLRNTKIDAIPSEMDTSHDGVYSLPDDYGTSYYFRGEVENNYVKFGDFYWRIIRINGDGTLRIIYDGKQAYQNGVANTARLLSTSPKWNTSSTDNKYGGYMYGGTNGNASTDKDNAQTNETSSNIKSELESWYKTNIFDKGLDDFVSDTIFCNDRTTPGQEKTNWTIDTGLGYGSKKTGYGALSRIATGNNTEELASLENPTPTFKCSNKNDAFTKEDTKFGNGKLEQKVGLITADEVIAAGGKYMTKNQRYYLYKGYNYFTMSPSYFNNSSINNICVNSYGMISNYPVTKQYRLVPVINLTQDYVLKMTGNGTAENPYTVE